MPIYSVDTVAVADTAARTRTRIATIQTEVDAMRGDIGLLQSCWTGTAADSMATCAADWHLTQLQVQSNLDQISLALDNAAVCYDDAETANQGRFATPGTTTAPATGSGPVAPRWAGDRSQPSPHPCHELTAHPITGRALRHMPPAAQTKRRAATHSRERRPAARSRARPASRPGYRGSTGS